MSDEELDALEDPGAWEGVFDESTRAALALADQMCEQTHTFDGDLIAELRTHFSEDQLAELILICGQANLNNRAGNAAKQLLGTTEPGGALPR